MFSFFRKKNPPCAHKKSTEELLCAIRKVITYRKDLLSEESLRYLKESYSMLQELLKGGNAKETEILTLCQEIRGKLKKYGGDIYPQGFLAENAEVFLVAAIVAISIRTFFFQPFKIPTNSMYPTYAGMTFEVFSEEKPAPKSWRKFLRFFSLGTKSYRIQCPHKGEIFLPLMTRDDPLIPYGGFLSYRVIDGRKWLGLLPTKLRSYRLYIHDTPITIQVPLEFSLDDVILQAFFPEKTSWSQVIQGDIRRHIRYKGHQICFQTSIKKKRDEMLLSFDILTGDMLFVNRMCYHFRKPKIGDPFVFRTRNIPGLMGNDKYYIKRIVGQGGDTLKVQEPRLLRNGEMVDQCLAFQKNNTQTPPYLGYTASGSFIDGRTTYVPNGHFFAMGDNSPYSGDSRYWGTVPQKEVIGKACFIFYPFTSRWGIAQ
ncbi:MAG: signal peptidase I [Puniceicoccales bacterium]|jgi:signal peptidase I|nr:signal peptidase I [Puniceicoccales bacterium]